MARVTKRLAVGAVIAAALPLLSVVMLCRLVMASNPVDSFMIHITT